MLVSFSSMGDTQIHSTPGPVGQALVIPCSHFGLRHCGPARVLGLGGIIFVTRE